MASIKRRDQNGAESWQLRYRDGQGKERSKQFAKKSEAEAFRIKVEGEVVAGVHTPESTSVTIAEAADRFLTDRELRDIEFYSLRQYKGHVKSHIKPLIGSRKLATLTMADVKQFAQDLITTGRSRAMAVKVLSTFRSIIKNAQGDGLVAQNVAIGVQVPVSKRKSGKAKKVGVPLKTEVVDILEAAKARDAKRPGFYPMLLTAVFAGLRSSELRGLRKSDIDLKAATITIEQRADAGGNIGPPKSEAGFRTIPIPPMLVSVLRTWLLQCPNGPKGLAFPTSTGGVRLHSNTMHRDYYPTLVAAGVCEPTGKFKKNGDERMAARFGIHCLRHFAASSWIAGKSDLKRIQVWLGHASIQMTMDTYGHLMPDDDLDAAIARQTEAALFG